MPKTSFSVSYPHTEITSTSVLSANGQTDEQTGVETAFSLDK